MYFPWRDRDSSQPKKNRRKVSNNWKLSMPSSQAVSRHSGSPKKWRISTAEKRGENEIQNCTGNKISMHWISTQALPDGDVVCDERRQIRTYVQVCHYTVNVRQHWCARLTNWASCRVDHSDWLRRQFFQLRTCNSLGPDVRTQTCGVRKTHTSCRVRTSGILRSGGCGSGVM